VTELTRFQISATTCASLMLADTDACHWFVEHASCEGCGFCAAAAAPDGVVSLSYLRKYQKHPLLHVRCINFLCRTDCPCQPLHYIEQDVLVVLGVVQISPAISTISSS